MKGKIYQVFLLFNIKYGLASTLFINMFSSTTSHLDWIDKVVKIERYRNVLTLISRSNTSLELSGSKYGW